MDQLETHPRSPAASIAAERRNPPQLLSIKDTAAALGISRSKLFLEIKAGKIAFLKIGSRTLISDDEITRYLDSLPEIRRGRAA